MHALAIFSDFSGCRTYRLVLPFNELKRFGVRYTSYPYLPQDPTRGFFENLLNFIYPYDFVIVQRCNKLNVMAPLRQACDVLGKKLIYESDDDYLHIPDHNPCSIEFRDPRRVYEFIEILKMADLITVTTDELKSIYYPFNRNIVVLPNNVEEVHYFKDAGELETDDQGMFSPINQCGLAHVPAYIALPNGAKKRLIRIGYTGTETHRIDFNTIKTTWFKTIKKLLEASMRDFNAPSIQVIYIGDKYFAEMHAAELGKDNMMFIAPSNYDSYYYNIRNLDIGIAPLETNVFNMSKSPIKAIEYGSWGIPAILPNYITYDREFQDEQTCLMYNNQQEFGDQLVRMVMEPDLRKKMGHDVRQHVLHTRTEPVNSEKRLKVYQDALNISRPIKIFEPHKEMKIEEVQAAS